MVSLDWRLAGLHFALVGMIVFGILTFLHELELEPRPISVHEGALSAAILALICCGSSIRIHAKPMPFAAFLAILAIASPALFLASGLLYEELPRRYATTISYFLLGGGIPVTGVVAYRRIRHRTTASGHLARGAQED